MNAVWIAEHAGSAALDLAPWLAVLKLYLDRKDAAKTLLAAQKVAANAEAAASANARNDLIKIAQDAAGQVIQNLRDEAESLRERVELLEGELDEMRRRLGQSADSIAAKDAELAMLRGRLRQVLATLVSHESKMTAAGIAFEKHRQEQWMIEAGDYPAELEPTLGIVRNDRRREPT